MRDKIKDDVMVTSPTYYGEPRYNNKSIFRRSAILLDKILAVGRKITLKVVYLLKNLNRWVRIL